MDQHDEAVLHLFVCRQYITRENTNWLIFTKLGAMTQTYKLKANISINESIKIYFQAMTKKFNTINVTAFERLPEKHCAY